MVTPYTPPPQPQTHLYEQMRMERRRQHLERISRLSQFIAWLYFLRLLYKWFDNARDLRLISQRLPDWECSTTTSHMIRKWRNYWRRGRHRWTISQRRKAIQDSNVLNYQNEYNRIRGVLESQKPGLRGNTLERLRQREGELALLGAKAVSNIV